MKNINLKNLRPLTVITGVSFSGKTALLKEIAKETSAKYINIDTDVEIKIKATEELQHWFRFLFGINFIPDKQSIYALRIISLGLSCQENDVLIIENPELGLHPKEASKIAKFLVYLVSKRGAKVFVETNSTDIVTSICYEVYVSNIYYKKVMFLNKADKNSIEKVFVDEYGKFIDKSENLRKYPSGFFDANTKELYSLL